MFKSKFFISMAVLALSLSVVSGAAIATDNTDVWENIENNYYANSARMSAARVTDDSVLMGSQLNANTLTKMFTSENLNTSMGIAAFITSVETNGLQSSLSHNNTFLVTVEGATDPIAGTAIIIDGIVTQVIEEDKGDMYAFSLTLENKSRLSSSELTLTDANAYFVMLDGFMHGIVLDDGTTQMVKVISSYKDILDSDVYSLTELITALKDNESILTALEGLNSNLDEENPDIMVG